MTQKKKAALAGVLLLAVLIAVVLAAPSLRARIFGVPLEMRWQSGRQDTFVTTVAGKVRLDVGGLAALALPPAAARLANQDIPFEIVTRSRRLVKSVAPDGVATLEVSPQGGTYQITLMGMEHRGRIAPSGNSIVRIDARGRLVDTNSGSAPTSQQHLADEALSGIDAGLLPGGRKRPGAVWEHPVNVPLRVKGFQISLQGSVHHRLVGVQYVGGSPAADLESHADVTVEVVPAATATSLAGMVLKGAVKLDSQSFLNWRESRMEASSGSGTLDLQLAAKVPVLGSLAMGTRTAATFTIKTNRIP